VKALLTTTAPVRERQKDSLLTTQKIVHLEEKMFLPPRIPLLVAHNYDAERVIGSAKNLYVDRFGEHDMGLYGELEFINTKRGNHFKMLVEGGHVKGLSIGFSTLQSECVRPEEVVEYRGEKIYGPAVIARVILLLEVSLTVNPADRRARVLLNPGDLEAAVNELPGYY